MSTPRWIRRREPQLVPIGPTVWQLLKTFECVTPYPPPPRNATWGIEGRLVFSLCPFPDESADVNQSWCQSDSFPRLFNCCPPKTPQTAPLVSRGAICLAYIHSNMNLHMCAIFCVSRPSRLVAFSEFVLRFVRLFAAVGADSRKNTTKK